MIQNLDRIIERASNIGLLISGILITLMAFLSTYGVTRRYALQDPEPYSYEISTIFLLVCVVFAIAGVQRLGRNLRVDFVANQLSKNIQYILLNILAPVLALFYVVILTWQSWGDAWYSMQIWETSQSAWEEPLWPTKMAVPVGAGLLCFVLLAQLTRGIASLVQGSNKPGE